MSTFVIDAYEVSVARFRAYWKDGHPRPSKAVSFPNGRSVTVGAATEPLTSTDHNSYNWSPEPAGREDLPINRLTWHTAFAFCVWDGGRLPTEAEWEYAATGRAVDGLVGGRTYPWGESTPSCDLAHSHECHHALTLPVQAFVAYGGLFQMVGNVMEWTADTYEAYGGACWNGAPLKDPLCWSSDIYYFTLRGGSFRSEASNLSGTYRVGFGGSANSRGMRCARDIVSAVTSTP